MIVIAKKTMPLSDDFIEDEIFVHLSNKGKNSAKSVKELATIVAKKPEEFSKTKNRSLYISGFKKYLSNWQRTYFWRTYWRNE